MSAICKDNNPLFRHTSLQPTNVFNSHLRDLFFFLEIIGAPKRLQHQIHQISILLIFRKIRDTHPVAVIVAAWLVVVTLSLFFLYYCASTLDVTGATKKFVHFLQRNSFRLWNQKYDIEYQQTVYTGKHWRISR